MNKAQGCGKCEKDGIQTATTKKKEINDHSSLLQLF